MIAKIIDSLELAPDDTVVEIGPGRGALTRGLLAKGVTVIAVEVDRDLIPVLENEFSDYDKLTVINANFLDTNIRSLIRAGGRPKIVGNLPYYISTPILQRLIDQLEDFDRAVLMFQREVVERLTAEPGNRERGFITVVAESAFRIERVADVPPRAFSPVPKVWSSVVRLLPKPGVHVSEAFRALVSAGFAQKRKTLLNNFKTRLPNAEVMLQKAGIAPNRRAESLTLEEWDRLLELADPGD